MKGRILATLAAGTLAAPALVQAAPITELFRVTLPSASGVYDAGHVFDITVTYDDAGTSHSSWRDGPNGVAEFGGGDDIVSPIRPAIDSYPGATVLSDAVILIAGLAALPVGATPNDVRSSNVSFFASFEI